ncbi:21271_t:CDS:2 [Dentiscutata erythropus]|uniref:21271_t:CDS:1 n=1 Tax=Dentiscutata erythropus TaxID=1348616 RepID=A0A9N9P0F7_9GLOM|nr:21271_t:CDS:2 [Dentiscutata erythropus]
MTEPIMPKINDEFESLEAFKNVAKSATKYRGFAFSKKDSNLTRCNGKSPFVVLQCTKGGEWYNSAVNKTIDGGIILSKNIINECACIRLALNEGYNNDSTQILLRLFKEDQALRNASDKVFPETDKMLCVWHLLEQNLKVNCRKLFKTDNDYEAFKKEQSNTPLNQIFNTSQLSNSKQFEINILKFMNEYFSAYIDVKGDSNCSFCAIVISIRKPEDYWLEVRKLIYKELCTRKSYYIQLFLKKEKEYDKILFIVQWKAGSCSKDHWMSMLSFEYVIANTFQ